MTSVMLGLPVDASPWAVFEELGQRGYWIGIAPGQDGWLRATAVRQAGPLDGEIHAVEAETIGELALQLAASVCSPWES